MKEGGAKLKSLCLSLYIELVNTVDGAIRLDRFHRETKNIAAPTIRARATSPVTPQSMIRWLTVTFSPPTTPPAMAPTSVLVRTKAVIVLEAIIDIGIVCADTALGKLPVDSGAPKQTTISNI